MAETKVRSLNPTGDLERFCNFLYGEEEGYVHLPIKHTETDEYDYNFFFKWPTERKEVIQHVERYSKFAEIFITPGMFRSRSSNVSESHGSYVAWADFDGNVPTLEELEENGVPMPTLRVQSSVLGHEHWYWRYEQFNNDVASIQGINKAICYALKGDTGAWDAGHSLRPVGSINHKRGALPVTIKAHSNDTFVPEDFSEVPVPQDSYNLEQFKREQIPSFIRVLGKYPFSDEALNLIAKKGIRQGSRSSALAALAYYCCEIGLDNSEVYSMLQWKDKQWKKFVNRPDKERYYVDLVNFARQKVPYEGIKDVAVLADEIQTFTFTEVLESVDDTKWIIDGILPEKGRAYIVGRSGTGKTTLSLGLTMNLALSKKYLDWESTSEKNYKVLFLSLEMNLGDVSKFYTSLRKNFSEEEVAQLDKNFHTYASPEKIKFYQPTSPLLGKFLRKLENLRPDIILVDSASFSLAANLRSEEEVLKSVELLDRIQDKYDCSTVFIHHSRKEPPGHGYKEADLDDVFGSTFIAASAASIIALKPSKNHTHENKYMDVRYLKKRFSGDSEGFTVVMNGEKRIFEKPTVAALPSAEAFIDFSENNKKDERKSFFDH